MVGRFFQLCVGTVLFRAQLAEQVNLEEKFITNQQRFELVCKIRTGEIPLWRTVVGQAYIIEIKPFCQVTTSQGEVWAIPSERSAGPISPAKTPMAPLKRPAPGWSVVQKRGSGRSPLEA